MAKLNYENYRLTWMISHGYSLSDLMRELDIMQEEYPDMTASELFSEWEYGFGFHSEIWACKEEYEDYEAIIKG